MSGASVVPGGGDVVGELRDVLAGVVGADPERVDPQQPFAALGLDSLLTAELVAAIHQHFGIRITGGALYEFSTPALLAGHLSALREGSPAPAVRTPDAPSPILESLRRQLAGRLHCDVWEIEADAPFVALGIDSILAADFVAGINDAYGLHERPLTLHEHPTLAAMASYIGTHTGTTTAISDAPAMASSSGDAPAAPAGLASAPSVSGTGVASAVGPGTGSARSDVLDSGGAPGAVQEVLAVLRERLARILHCEPWEIEGGAFLSELGIGSQLADDFVAGVNRAYGMDQYPVTAHEQRSLAAMAAYITTRTRGMVTDTASTPSTPESGYAPASTEVAPEPTAREKPDADAVAASGTAGLETPTTVALAAGATTAALQREVEPKQPVMPAAAKPALSQEEMLALLDAVRGERIGVDEAAALLTGRSA
ncbi:phosphopantetheine-binding protein [Streptomyces sp. NPDC054842]